MHASQQVTSKGSPDSPRKSPSCMVAGWRPISAKNAASTGLAGRQVGSPTLALACLRRSTLSRHESPGVWSRAGTSCWLHAPAGANQPLSPAMEDPPSEVPICCVCAVASRAACWSCGDALAAIRARGPCRQGRRGGPAFTGTDSQGQAVSLAQYKGKFVVLGGGTNPRLPRTSKSTTAAATCPSCRKSGRKRRGLASDRRRRPASKGMSMVPPLTPT